MTIDPFSAEFLTLAAIGFVAQLIDGSLGMAFGVVSTTAMLTFGVPPAHASAIVHTAEVFTTGASATSHIVARNVSWRLVLRLGSAGVVGAILGAYVLSNIDGKAIQPFIAAYLLLMGLFILQKAMRAHQPIDAPPSFAGPLGLVGGFFDAIGGGGWGPMVSSTLIGSGHAPRMVIGSVNTAEWFVTVAAATTFFIELGLAPTSQLIALVVGGVLAAPFGAIVVRRVPARALMWVVGFLVVGLASFQLWRAFA